MIHEKPKNEIFASDAKAGEIVEFPNVKRGWGVTENLGFIPPMEYFNAAFNRVDKALAYQLQRGVSEWSADEEYPVGALSVFNGTLYQAKTQNSNKKPSDNTSLWGVVINEAWAKTNLLGKTEKAADSDKLDGLDSSAFARIEHTLVKRGLPKGDYRSVGFWRTVEAGWYSYNHDSIQGSNNPSAYGIIHVIKDGNDFNILWYRKGTAEIYRAGFNGSLAENSTIGWNIIAASLTTGSYPDTAVLRDGNGDFAGRRVSAIHIAASVHVASQASPTIDLSRADNFEITLTGSGVFTLLNGIKGQSGVITISNAATNITGYASNIKWRTTPTNLQATETFAYFVWHDGYISIGRV